MAGRRTTRRTRSVSPRDGQPPIRHELSPTWHARPAARRERPRHGMRRTVIIVAVMLCAAIALFASIPRLMRFVWPASGPEPRRASDAYCSATLSSGDNKEMLSVEQALNAEIITRAAVKRGLPDHAATVAIATAMQETRLMNLSYGDRDSVGLFQQRPSQGWGTKEQLMDETYAANRFYDELVKVPNWQSVPVEDAAQSVQRSQYPDRYADWTSLAQTWAAGLTGETGAGVACALEPAQPSDADVDGLTSDFRNEFPTVMVSQPSSLEPSSKTQDDGGDKTADNSAANDGSGKTTSVHNVGRNRHRKREKAMPPSDGLAGGPCTALRHRFVARERHALEPHGRRVGRHRDRRSHHHGDAGLIPAAVMTSTPAARLV